MKASVLKKLEHLKEHYAVLSKELSDPAIISDQNKFRDLSKEFAQLEPIIVCFNQFEKTTTGIDDAKAMMEEADSEMKALAQEELRELQNEKKTLEEELQVLLLPHDPNDECNIYLEIRAGTGGDEAAIFAGDLLRMYSRHVEMSGWKMEILSETQGDHGGYKEIITRVIGAGVYSTMKFESGAHRVQRVPETESQGRVHTSACTVAVLPELAAVEAVEINPADLRIDTFRASGAGGQHVNKTDSAIRITHIPTGIVVECQEDRSQHKNRAKAMSLLSAKIVDTERSKQEKQQAQTRRNLVGSGDRSERIRTYNFPQGRITDHRINLTLYKLEEIMQGNMSELIEALLREHQTDLLSAMGDE